MFIFPGGATVSVTPVTFSNTDNSVSSANQTVYTFSSQAIGTAGANRQVVVGFGCRTDATVSTVTIGGVSASSLAEVHSAGLDMNTALYKATVPSGTTGDVVITYSGGVTNCGLGVWAVYDAGSSNVVDSDIAGTTTPDGSIAAPANSVVVAFAFHRGAVAPTMVWDELNEDFQTIVESGGQGSMSGAATAYASGATVDIGLVLGGSSNVGLVGSSFAP